MPEDAGPAVDLAAMRQNYTMAGLSEDDLAGDWLTQFRRWLAEAVAAGVTEPNAMVLATASAAGLPSARTVLAKDVHEGGVVFYTNLTSTKGRDLEENPHAAATFPWYTLQRQIQVRGTVHAVDRDTTKAYWDSRPRNSRLGAWASPQSAVVRDRRALDDLQAAVADRFADPDPDGGPENIALPPHWGGWRIDPVTVEFWQGRTGRMHDRLRYRRQGDDWIVERLAP